MPYDVCPRCTGQWFRGRPVLLPDHVHNMNGIPYCYGCCYFLERCRTEGVKGGVAMKGTDEFPEGSQWRYGHDPKMEAGTFRIRGVYGRGLNRQVSVLDKDGRIRDVRIRLFRKNFVRVEV